MLNILVALAITAAPPPQVQEFCVVDQPISQKAPAGIAGAYEVIGRPSGFGQAYFGRITVKFVGDGYEINRIVNGVLVRGKAWPVKCGPDKVRQLKVSYFGRTTRKTFYCSISNNYDNFTIVNCGSASVEAMRVVGIETWIQRPE